jgi:hypothetical protein
MSTEFDKEIDALLRGRARREDARAGDGAMTAHLDADELAAFAERTLPDAARTRYAAHLADCDDCRRTATRLALAAGVPVSRDEHEVIAGRDARVSLVPVASWRERIGALFAPRAWRYAMPVVALLCVGVVALIVMRRVPREDLQLARNGGASQVGEASESARAENHAESATPPASQPFVQSPAQTQSSNDSISSAMKSPEADAEARRNEAASNRIAKDQNESQVGGAVAGAASSAPTASAVEQQRVEELSRVATAPAMVSTPATTPSPLPPPPMPAPTPAPSRADEIAMTSAAPKEQRSETAQTRTKRAERKNNEAAANAPSTSSRTALSADEANAAPSNRNAAGGAALKKSQPPGSSDDDAMKSKNARDKSPAATRAVGGRKFRREGGAWIDTAYNSGQATTNVRRNSEQYRALVSDEPEIGRIADTLGGELIVVWKGRAYRIR